MTADKKSLGPYIDYIIAQTRTVIASFGPRTGGSPGECDAQRYIAGELARYVDETAVEPFDVYPKAFMSFVPVSVVLVVTGMALYWVCPSAAALFSLLALAYSFIEFVTYTPFFDPFFPKAASLNVIGIRRARNEPRRRIILSGHADAAREWRYNMVNPELLKAVVITGIGGALVTAGIHVAGSVSQLTGWAQGSPWWTMLGAAEWLFLPSFIALLFFVNPRVVAPGANDNLSGVFVSLAAAKYLHDKKIRFDHTEVWILSTGSEEEGLRGAKAYAKRHNAELKARETVFLGLETFRDLEHLAIYARDMNGLVRNDSRVDRLLKDAAAVCGHDLPFGSVYLGATDAAAFTQAGIPASALAAMDPNPPRYYHTRWDDWTNMDPHCLREALAITLEAVARYDANGLGG